MLECTFIFRKRFFRLTPFFFLAVGMLLGSLSLAPSAHAQDAGGNPPSNNTDPANSPAVPPGTKKEESTGLFDQSSPYLQYGDFNMDEDEDADTQYFQYGRFFGLSLGIGYESATGNRGQVYSPAFPRLDVRMAYWFDFNFAMDLGVFFASHNLQNNNVTTTVKLIGYGVDFKYYFDVGNAAATVTFANPFIFVGAGAISKSQTDPTSANADTDSTLSVSFGAGVEFPISYKKTYFSLEGRYSTESFTDSTVTDVSRVPDLSGGFISIIGSFMFVW